jgi:hypothetical protein
MLGFLVVVVLACLGGSEAARALPPSCARGAPFEVYRYDAQKSFHAISGYKAGVPSKEACAASKGCRCALYRSDRTCVWRTSACHESELFVNDRPTRARYGLIHMCPCRAA